MPHPKPAEGNVALISPPEGAVAAAAPAPEADDRWVWFEDEHGERFRVPRSWVQGAPADASNAGGSAEEADPDEAGGIRIKNPTLSRMFEGVRLTSGQASLVPKLQAFLDDDEARIFILRGYAGTGKTFLMKSVVDYLSAVNRSVHLMAPTGRAAKVLSTRTSRSASTIHAHLYSPRDRDDPDDEDFTLVSDLTSNTDELDAVYVVDEASMVSDRETQNPLLQFGSGRLLADLLHFLEDAPCAHRRHILFVGDAAQLPPVGMTVSPALSPVHLEAEFGMKPSEHTLTDIVRQKQDSGILALATALRTGLKNKTYALPRLPADVPDVERIDTRDMARLCWEVMGRRITRDAVMIAQTNVRAQQLNRAFRRLQFPGVEELAAGDKLMVILNTHMHGEFICNGDFCQVLRTGARTRRSVSFRVKTGPAGKGRRLVNLDLEFQSVTLRLRGNTGECFEVSCMILLHEFSPLRFLSTPGARLKREGRASSIFCNRDLHILPCVLGKVTIAHSESQVQTHSHGSGESRTHPTLRRHPSPIWRKLKNAQEDSACHRPLSLPLLPWQGIEQPLVRRCQLNLGGQDCVPTPE